MNEGKFNKLRRFEVTKKVKIIEYAEGDKPRFVHLLCTPGGYTALDEAGGIWVRWNAENGDVDKFGQKKTVLIQIEDDRAELMESNIVTFGNS